MRDFFRRLTAPWRKTPPAPSPPSSNGHTAAPVQPAQEKPNPPKPDHSSGVSPSEAEVYQALRNCRDPEIPVNIVDLGLIYDVHILEDQVRVKMTLTTQGCGMGGHIAQEAEGQIRALPGVRDAQVEIVWDPPWNPAMISQAGRKTLGLPEE